MLLKQFYLPCLAYASYIIGDEETGTPEFVDPQRDTDQYINSLCRTGAGRSRGDKGTASRVAEAAND